jgi:pyruvate-ferredoxin/flavodoxin oxidoreductase
MSKKFHVLDANEAVAYVAYMTHEVISIYPITPSSPMGEWADQWSAEGKKNIWGNIPRVFEMQSEGGVAGAVHGALQAGSLTTTFTASQGLLLMLPNMYKIAGELTPAVVHVAARSLAAQGLSIFGDHSDVMQARPTGWGILSSNSVQEAMDMALIAFAASLESRIPFVHFFDGFRTSHEVMKIEFLEDAIIRKMIEDKLVHEHRARALTPEKPVMRGTAQNPDVYFQSRETVNPYYISAPEIVQNAMDKFAGLTGRQYKLYEYLGAHDAEKVIVLMGSGAETVQETIEFLQQQNEKVGLVKVRLYRPFDGMRLLDALPDTARKIAILDRTKEPGSAGEPLYLDVLTAITEAYGSGKSKFQTLPKITGGRYGLSSKEFTPAMVKGIYDELEKENPKNHFTIGINDDLTHSSIDYDPSFTTEADETVRALFYGLGSDGTVGANKNSIKIIGENTDLYTQGYFVYDSRKSGSVTTSHLRFGPEKIHSAYLISQASFIACHQFTFIDRIDMLKFAERGATFLLNSPFAPEAVWQHLPETVQQTIIEQDIKFYVIDAYKVARSAGMGNRINTVMQTCFFAISGIIPKEKAIEAIKESIHKTYGKRGEIVVKRNCDAVDSTLEHLHEVAVPTKTAGTIKLHEAVSKAAPAFVQEVTAAIIRGEGDDLPVSKLPADGTYPTGTTRWEKRNIAQEIPVWDEDICIQCGKCVMVCPHGVIRSKVFDGALLENAPDTFKTAVPRWNEFKEQKFTLQVAPEDCTGCSLCVEVCPVKNKKEVRLKAINMMPQAPIREQEKENWDFFLNIPNTERNNLDHTRVKDTQLLEPLFEFSGACAGCGETPYLKLLTQLYGDRMCVANATGCSSIYGGNLPTTPWAQNQDGKGPAWSNSLFEDNAEFGLGMRVSIDKQKSAAEELLSRLKDQLDEKLVDAILHADQSTGAGIEQQRKRVETLKTMLEEKNTAESADLKALADALVEKSVWIIGGDGWAYDIGYGGLDHVLSTHSNVNVLVMDTEVYSNTGGQCSKSTPKGAVAKFATKGKDNEKKDLGLMAMSYGHVYVASVAMGANDAHTIKAIREAEAYDGPSLIIAYTHCIAHGYDLKYGISQQDAAVKSGSWLLYRFDPRRKMEGQPALQLDCRPPKLPLEKYIYNETRYKMLVRSDPENAKKLLDESKREHADRRRLYEYLANLPTEQEESEKPPADNAATQESERK